MTKFCKCKEILGICEHTRPIHILQSPVTKEKETKEEKKKIIKIVQKLRRK